MMTPMLGMGIFWIGAIGCVVMAALSSFGAETAANQERVNGWWWGAIICAFIGLAV